MKNKLLFLCALLVTGYWLLITNNSVQSQTLPPSLTQANFPSNGDSVNFIMYQLPVAVTFDANNTNPIDSVSMSRSVLKALNMIGDDSLKTIGSQTGHKLWYLLMSLYNQYGSAQQAHTYKTPKSNTGGYSNFKSSNLFYKTDTISYFYEINSSGLSNWGSWSQNSYIISTTAMPVVNFPITYNTKVNVKHTLVNSTISDAGQTLPMSSSVDVNVQAYGKIEINSGTVQNPKFITYDSCYLVTYHEMDSINYSGLGNLWTETENYNIYSPRLTEPVISFQYVKSRNDLEAYWSLYSGLVWYDTFDMFYVLNNKKLNAGINEIQKNNYYSVYPNPTDGNVNIKLNSSTISPLHIQVTDVLGKTVYVNDFGSGISELNINLTGKSSGMYFLKMTSGNNSSTEKIIKR